MNNRPSSPYGGRPNQVPGGAPGYSPSGHSSSPRGSAGKPGGYADVPGNSHRSTSHLPPPPKRQQHRTGGCLPPILLIILILGIVFAFSYSMWMVFNELTSDGTAIPEPVTTPAPVSTPVPGSTSQPLGTLSLQNGIQANHTRQDDSSYLVSLRAVLAGLNPKMTYVAGYMMCLEGQELMLSSIPQFYSGSQSIEITAKISVSLPGRYEAAVFYYPLSNPEILITDRTLLVINAQAGDPTPNPIVTPDPDSLFSIPSTPKPAPTPSPTPTLKPTKKPTPKSTLKPTKTTTPKSTLKPKKTTTPKSTLKPTKTTTPKSTLKPKKTTTPKSTPKPTKTPAAKPTPGSIALRPTSDVFDVYPVNTRYYYNLLNDEEKALFSMIYDEVVNCAGVVDFKDCSFAVYERVMEAILKDCPELIHVDLSNVNGYTNLEGTVAQYLDFKGAYRMDKQEYRRQLNQILDMIDSFKSKPGFGPSDFSKQLMYYDHLIQNSYYDKEKTFCANADSVWLHGYAKCTGYSHALTLALRRNGIECFSITGNTYDNGIKAPTGHMWTVAKIDGTWVQCDATWDDPDEDSLLYQGDGDHYLPYFNITDQMMLSARKLDETHFTYPTCTSMQQNYSYKKGRYIRSGDNIETAIIKGFKDALASGVRHFGFVFEDFSSFNWLLLNMDSICSSSNFPNGVSFTYYNVPETHYFYFQID
ncbi:MAG: hypothetical protein J6K32_12155 [Clostridia bacterium]|nr:hypothetical protein [Clostridia bacterium]